MVAATAAILAGPLCAQPRDSVERAARDSIRALDLQTELPRLVEPTRIDLPAEFLWVALFCALALLAWSARDLLPLWGRGADEPWDERNPGSRPPGADEADALALADRWSQEGRLVEAIHLLLLQGLADIRRQLGEPFADSQTSREILRSTHLTTPVRAALGGIVAAVERTYFGGYPAKPADYATCRRDLETLRTALRSRAPA
jgi:hypothetical protein